MPLVFSSSSSLRTSPIFFFSFVLHRFLCSSASAAAMATATAMAPPPLLPLKLKNLCYRYCARTLTEARSALTECLHSTRSLPFSYAELIASQSPFSLFFLLSFVPFPLSLPNSDFPHSLRRILSFCPVNEFDFYFQV